MKSMIVYKRYNPSPLKWGDNRDDNFLLDKDFWYLFYEHNWDDFSDKTVSRYFWLKIELISCRMKFLQINDGGLYHFIFYFSLFKVYFFCYRKFTDMDFDCDFEFYDLDNDCVRDSYEEYTTEIGYVWETRYQRNRVIAIK